MKSGENSIALIDVAAVLVRRRRMIGTAVLAAFLISSAVSLVLPRWYKSTALVLPPESSVSQFDIAGVLQSVGIIQPAQLPTLATPSDVYKAILESQTVRFAVVDSFDLMSAYRRKVRQKAVDALKKHSDIAVTDEGLIRVTIEDRSPSRAANMANAHVYYLDCFNRESSSGRARRTREFVEKRLADTQESLQRAEQALKDFQVSTGAVVLPEQAAATIETAAELWRGITELEVALASTAGFETERSPRAVRLRAQINELKTRLQQLDGFGSGEGDFVRAGTGSASSFLIGLRDAPDLALQYGRKLRDVEIQKTVFQFLTRQYEEAKIQEARDTPTVQILDAAVPAEIAARPRKKVIVAAVTGLALLLSVVWSFALERWEGIQSDETTSARWSALLGGRQARLRDRSEGASRQPPEA